MELRFGEGGDDSKIFVGELFEAYHRYAVRRGFTMETLHNENGHIMAKVAGARVFAAFSKETGQHCCQRVPVTERSGRRHTSLVSVGVLPIKDDACEPIPLSELDITQQKGTLRAGGQKANKTSNAIRAIHIPTGLRVFIQNERSMNQNKETAIKILTAKVNDQRRAERDSEYTKFRREQLGTGSRGMKIRTYNFIDSRASDHRSGVKTSQIRRVMNGEFELLFV